MTTDNYLDLFNFLDKTVEGMPKNENEFLFCIGGSTKDNILHVSSTGDFITIATALANTAMQNDTLYNMLKVAIQTVENNK